MEDKRSQRRVSVAQFLTRLDKDRLANFASIVKKAKSLNLEGFDFDTWDDASWTICSGRLLKLSGKNVNQVTLNFYFAPTLGGTPMDGEWADMVKAFIALRFHRSQQAAPNQRNFITAISYVVYEMVSRGDRLFQLTPEILDLASNRLAKDYSDGVAYNMHKAIGEFGAHCDANGLCNIFLNYKFSGMKRPENTGGIGQKRLDDKETLTTGGDKLVHPKVFKIIGELYLNVPEDHKYRLYVLVLTLIAMLGRRFSEIATLPNQVVNKDDQGRSYLKYFPRKQSQGDVFTPMRNLYLPTDVVSIIEPVISELKYLCTAPRTVASEMHVNREPDLFFLFDFSDDKRFYKGDLKKLHIPINLLDPNGWIRKNGLAFSHVQKITLKGKASKSLSWFTRKNGLIAYCKKDFNLNSLEPIHIDQHGQKYFLKDLLIVKDIGLSSGAYAHWVATQLTHSMLTTFLRYFPELATKYASSSLDVDFTSHHFRHTLNTLLDEGGLSDLLQTEWFGRSNSRDTKAYQHTSREKRALMLRADIKDGKVGGRLAEQIKLLPIGIQDAVLSARVNAVHDVGPGICVHNFVQTPCERHLQCSADCNDYVWAKGDEGRKEELKRIYAVTLIARKTAEAKTKDQKPKKSSDWLAHNDKKLSVLSKQMADYQIEPFDPISYLEERIDD